MRVIIARVVDPGGRGLHERELLVRVQLRGFGALAAAQPLQRLVDQRVVARRLDLAHLAQDRGGMAAAGPGQRPDRDAARDMGEVDGRGIGQPGRTERARAGRAEARSGAAIRFVTCMTLY